MEVEEKYLEMVLQCLVEWAKAKIAEGCYRIILGKMLICFQCN